MIFKNVFFCCYFLNRLSHGDGKNAATLTVAEQYVRAFDKLARTNNTLILPSNAGDISSIVGQAMSIYGAVTKNNQLSSREIEKANDDNTK